MDCTILDKIHLIKLKYSKTKSSDKYFKMLSEIAQIRRGKIKEEQVYINNYTKMIFIDQLGNEFKITPSNVKCGHWSPFETNKVRDPSYNIKELSKIAQSKGGKIKEGEQYINAHTKMAFIDKSGNEFKMADFGEKWKLVPL